MSSSPSDAKPRPLPVGTVLHSQQGRAYTIEEVLHERLEPALACVYRARSHGESFAVKHIRPGNFAYQQALQKRVASSPHVRTVVDTVPDGGLFVYPFLAANALLVPRLGLSDAARKDLLRSALAGLADLHEQGIYHSDIKPNNILFDLCRTADHPTTVERVQIIDLENAMLVPPGQALLGPPCGHALWRAPESWAGAPQYQATDVFSFGVVAIYVMLQVMVLRGADEDLAADNDNDNDDDDDDDAWRPILRRHLSTFYTGDGYLGLLRHLGEDNVFFGRIVALAQEFGPDRPVEPFRLWTFADASFRDLVGQMTSLDPKQRITAREALAHPWWEETKGVLGS